jgi:hypothetical protein
MGRWPAVAPARLAFKEPGEHVRGKLAAHHADDAETPLKDGDEVGHDLVLAARAGSGHISIYAVPTGRGLRLRGRLERREQGGYFERLGDAGAGQGGALRGQALQVRAHYDHGNGRRGRISLEVRQQGRPGAIRQGQV